MLSPKQAFDAIKTLYPDLKRIFQCDSGRTVAVLPKKENNGVFEDGYWGLGIDWAGTTEYPLPEPKWRPAEWPRDAANPPKECRMQDMVGNRRAGHWNHGNKLAGLSTHGWLDDDGCYWDLCEVIDE